MLNGLLGNTASGLVDAYDAYKGQNGKNGFQLYGMGIAGGLTLGIPVASSAPPGVLGPVGVAINAGIDALSTSSSVSVFAETTIGDSVALPVALAKSALDTATFGAGYLVCHN